MTHTNNLTTTLFKIDNTGNTRQWTIRVEDLGEYSTLTVNSGIVNGKFVEQITKITNGLNIGKSNETTMFEQAQMNMQSEINSKLKTGYVEDLKDFKGVGVKESGCPQVMLAKTYDPNKKQSGSKDLKGYKLEGVRIGIQHKFDGVRRLSHYINGQVTMYTRSGDISSTLPHIEMQLIEKCKFHNYNDIWFDGEAFTNKVSFNKVNGITRKGAKTLEDKINTLLIDYHIYDVISTDSYQVRSEIIKNLSHDNIIPVETEYIIASTELLKSKFEEYIALGHEGLMIRQLDVPYEHKRSLYLLKYKAFDDSEFICIDINPTSDNENKAGAMLVHFPNQPEIQFKATIVDTDDNCLDIFANKHIYIGQKVTVNYFGLSEYGIPRFPRVKGLRLNQ
jgi:hypothetical protein